MFGVLGGLLAFHLVLIATGILIRQTRLKRRYERMQPYGRLVDVFDGRMQVCLRGEGPETIVLLPGLGVGLPSADFGPLMRELAKNYRVAVVEYFGVGFSGATARPRSAANYVEEIREALRGAGLRGPYTLMPHSISGLYAECYAALYPCEVRAIICLDGSSSDYWEKTPAILNAIIALAKLQQSLGLSALLGVALTNRARLRGYGFEEREIDDMIAFSAFSINDTLLRQIKASFDLVLEAKALPYPPQVPYLKLIARESYEKTNRQLKMSPQEYQERHLSRIGPHARREILDGNHFIYLNNAERIAELTKAFLEETSGVSRE